MWMEWAVGMESPMGMESTGVQPAANPRLAPEKWKSPEPELWCSSCEAPRRNMNRAVAHRSGRLARGAGLLQHGEGFTSALEGVDGPIGGREDVVP